MREPFCTTRFMVLAILQILLCVTASLLAVWLLSQAVGFRFLPTVVAGLSGALCALHVVKQRRAALGSLRLDGCVHALLRRVEHQPFAPPRLGADGQTEFGTARQHVAQFQRRRLFLRC